jgi:hypothetical protein
METDESHQLPDRRLRECAGVTPDVERADFLGLDSGDWTLARALRVRHRRSGECVDVLRRKPVGPCRGDDRVSI